MNPCSPANITYTANPHYWQPGEPKVTKIEYPAYTSNNTANDELANGQAQWGAQYIPGIKAFYTSKSPNYHYWFPPTVNVSLVPEPDQPAAEQRQGPPGHLVRDRPDAGLHHRRVRLRAAREPDRHRHPDVLQLRWTSSALAELRQLPTTRPRRRRCWPRPATTMGSDGIMTNAKGQKLSFTVINIGDYSDWVAVDAGHPAGPQGGRHPASPRTTCRNTDFDADLYYGKYQLAYYDQQTFGPSPYYELNNWLNSADTAPVGKVAATNYERYSNPATDRPAQPVRDHHQRPPTQQSIMDQIQQVMLSDVPIIPVVEAVDWYQYDTASLHRLAHARRPVRPAVRVRLPGHGAGAAAPRAK